MIGAAFDQWPEGHECKPDDAEYLRKWLLCKAGYREVTEIATPQFEGEPAVARLLALAMEAAIRAADGIGFVRPAADGSRVAVYKAKSIAWDKLDQAQFNEIRSRVEAIIEQVIGVSGDELLKNKDLAA